MCRSVEEGSWEPEEGSTIASERVVQKGDAELERARWHRPWKHLDLGSKSDKKLPKGQKQRNKMSRSTLDNDHYGCRGKASPRSEAMASGDQEVDTEVKACGILLFDNPCSLLDVHGIFLCSGLS